MVRNYGIGGAWIPGVIATVDGNVNYKVLTADGRLIHRHVDQIVTRSAQNVVPQPEPVTVPGSLDGAPPSVPVSFKEREAFVRSPEVQSPVTDVTKESTPVKQPTKDTNLPSPSSASSSGDVPLSATGRPLRFPQKPIRFRDEQ